MSFDFVIYNANIVTLDDNVPRLRWLAVKDNIIAATGISDDSLPQAKSIIDLKGKTVMPGFIDSHVHGTLTGEALSGTDLSGSKTTDEIVNRIMAKNAKHNENSIICAFSYSGDEIIGERPTKNDLDMIDKNRAVVIYDKSYHGCILNSEGIRLSKIESGMPGVESKNGELTGLITDDDSYYFAIRNIMQNINEDLIMSYMKATEKYAFSKGITSIHSLDGGDYTVDMPTWIDKKDILDIHVVNYWETLDVNKAIEYGLNQIGGCICLDGTRALHTMALMYPYNDKPAVRGSLYYKDSDIYKFVKKAHVNDIQCSMHAAGTRAIDQYIYLIYQVSKEEGCKDLRHRIEHFSYPSDEHISLAVELELALPMQPVFTKVWDKGSNSLYKKRFGKNSVSVEPISKILKAGGHICGGSDSPVTLMDPINGIDACINTEEGREAISLDDALRIFTANGAWAAHEEGIRGKIKQGYAADFIVLNRDPYGDTSKFSEIAVEKTFSGGKLMYEI